MTVRERIVAALKLAEEPGPMPGPGGSELEAHLGEDGLVYVMDGQSPRYVMSVDVYVRLLDEHGPRTLAPLQNFS
jgi:hypothetical protein